MKFLKYIYKTETTEQLNKHNDNFNSLLKKSRCKVEKSEYKKIIEMIQNMLAERK